MNSTRDSTDDDDQKKNQLISLIPSGYKSPEFKTSFLHNFFMTPYQRQILRSQYSDCIQKVQINNKNYYVIIYDSEIQVVKLEGEQMHPIVTKVFCSFLIPLQKRKNPQIAQFLMLDRSNKLMFLEFDFNRENTPNFRTRKEKELEIFGKFENEIFQQIFLTTDDDLLLFISKQKLYVLNLLNQTINQIQNPLNHQNHLNQSKPILECSQNKKHIIVAEGNKIIIITDYYILNTHTIKKNQQIINIKLSQNQLFIVTNNSIVKIHDISNKKNQLQESDYLYIIDDIYYAHFEMENHNIIAILLINKSHEVLFIDYSNQYNREPRPKKLDIEKIDTSFVVKYIEIEKITGQSIRFRIFYFTQQKQLGSIICQERTFEKFVNENHAIVSSSVGPESYAGIMSFVDKDQLEPGCSVLLNQRSYAVVGIMQDEIDPLLNVMKVDKAPLESYADIGGLEQQIQEIKEAVELPLTHPEIYEDMGNKPPKGVILYGEPGTGKTLLAKAVANETSATFLRVVPKLVRELFRVSEEHAPSKVFIDEIDAVGTKRYDSHSGGEKEIQRTMHKLLNQLDGLDVKVILATNKIESLDPALIRPGCIDRKIEFPLPDVKNKKKIFQIHTGKMNLGDDTNLEEFVNAKDELSGADIKGMRTEAELLALIERIMTQEDFRKAKKTFNLKKGNIPEGFYI